MKNFIQCAYSHINNALDCLRQAISTRANPPSETSQNLVSSMEDSTVDDKGKDSEDDYSASVCAIMQRRNSSRRQSRRKRRPSSPFGVDVDNVARRRSSVYTTSSGELVNNIVPQRVNRIAIFTARFKRDFISYC